MEKLELVCKQTLFNKLREEVFTKGNIYKVRDKFIISGDYDVFSNTGSLEAINLKNMKRIFIMP